MATIAEMMVQSGLESSSKSQVDIPGSMAKGAQLAEVIDNMKMNRLKLEQTKAEHSLQKYSKVTDLIRIAHESKDPAIANSLWKYAIPKTVRALGADDAFTDEFLETAAKSPETREKVLGYQLEIQERIAAGMPATQAVAEVIPTISDPAARAALDTDRIIKAQEVRAGEEQTNKRNTETAQAALGKQVQQQQEAGNVEVRKKVGSDYVKFNADGGSSGAEAKIKKLKSVYNDLTTGKIKTGNVSNALPLVSGDKAQAVLNPDLKAAADKVRSAVSLKGSLDSQFSAKEAELAFGRSFDPALPNKQNAEKVKAMIDELENDVANKKAAFKEQGFKVNEVSPWKGKASAAKPGYSKLSPEGKKNFIQKFAEKYDVSIEEAKKALGD